MKNGNFTTKEIVLGIVIVSFTFWVLTQKWFWDMVIGVLDLLDRI